MTRALIHAGVGGFWTLLMAFTAGLALTLLSGEGYRPAYLLWLLSGALSGLAMAYVPVGRGWPLSSGLVVVLICILSLLAPFGQSLATTPLWTLLGVAAASIFAGVFGTQILKPVAAPAINRFRIEETLTQLLRGMGLLFFALIVIVPLYLMFVGSLYNTPSGESHDFAELRGGHKSPS